MTAETDILDFLGGQENGASISDIAASTGHTRATAAKYLELLKVRNQVNYREVGKAKLWFVTNTKKKVLIAEDDQHIRRLITVILGNTYDIIESENGADALEKVSEHMPDLLILDLMMPKVDGIEVCKQVKKNALTRKIPVLMLTAKGELSDKYVGVQVGADDYLTKPFDPRELRTRVKGFFETLGQDMHAITHLPLLKSMSKKIDGQELCYFYFQNLNHYKNHYGMLKKNEVIRLSSQIITHIVDNGIVGHDDGDNFIVALPTNSKQTINEIQKEFDSAIPFFYDVDYEHIQDDVIVQEDDKGKVTKIPLLALHHVRITKQDLNSDQLSTLRGEGS